MSKEDGTPQGDGDLDKTKGDDEPKITKDDLTNKYRDGRKEGIQKGSRDAINKINEILNTDFDSLEAIEEKLPTVIKSSAEESEVVQQLQDKLKEKSKAVENLSKKIQDFRVQGTRSKQINEAIGDRKLKLSQDDALTLFEANYGYTEEDGQLFATKGGEKFVNDSGDFVTVGEAFSQFASKRSLFEATAEGGTGGGTAGKGGADSNNPFVTGNKTEQARLFRENPEKYKILKAKAGK